MIAYINRFQHMHDFLLKYVAPELVRDNEAARLALQHLTVEAPRDPAHGDLATNIAMVLAKPLGKSPLQIANSIVPQLEAYRHVKTAQTAGAGFINITMKPDYWQQEIVAILQQWTSYGACDIGQDKRVNVEYVSANPTGPMHIGHARGAVVGDALANLLQKAGYDVVREYYINDAGGQVDVLARSVYLRYLEAYGEHITIPAGMYPAGYLIPVGQELKDTFGGTLLADAENEAEAEHWLPEVKRFAVEAMLQIIKEDLSALGIHHDVFTSEQSLHEAGWIEDALQQLQDKGLLYRGVLEAPKGKPAEDWEASEQLLFKSTDFGDDSDRPVKKSNGDYTYFAGDVGYTAQKLSRGFDTLVMMLGADHGGYVSRMQALVKALSGGTTDLKVQLCQMVKLMKDGDVMKMSKRSGSFVTVREVTDEVGKDVLRFMMLTRKPEQPLDFDLDKVREQSKDNPVFYVQYAHTRCKSVLRAAKERDAAAYRASSLADTVDVSLLASEAELQLIKLLASFPRIVESAARHYEPHRIAYFVQEVAAAFHSFWNLGSNDAAMRFIIEDNVALTTARLALVRSVATVLKAGLEIIGVEALEEMN
jgi:arginyl-tRNA synthetase